VRGDVGTRGGARGGNARRAGWWEISPQSDDDDGGEIARRGAGVRGVIARDARSV